MKYITHIGRKFLRNGGAEIFLRSIASHEMFQGDLQFRQSLCIDRNFYDKEFCETFTHPVYLGGKNEINKAIENEDIILFWGDIQLNNLGIKKPKVCILFVCSEEPNIVSKNSDYITHCIASSKRAALISCGNIPYTVIHAGFDKTRLTPTETRDSQRKKMNLNDDDFLVGMISRIGDNKRQFWLMEAIQKIKSEKIKAVFVGGGKDLKKLKNMNVRNCLFVGHQDDVANWYLSMDAFCILSKSEGGPTTLFESSYMRVPLIHTEFAFTKELCNSYNSFFVRDVKDLVEVIKTMYSLGRENLKKYTDNNYRIYEEFGNIEKSATNWYRTIKNVVAKKEREDCRLLL